MRLKVIGLIVLAGWLGCASLKTYDSRERAPASPSIQAAWVEPRLSHDQISDAAVVRVEVKLDLRAQARLGSLENLEISFLEKRYSFFPFTPEGNVMGALLPVPYLQVPGVYHVNILLKWGEDKTKILHQLPLEVYATDYDSETLQVARSKVTPPESVMERIRLERELTRSLYGDLTPQRIWGDMTQMPVNSIVTSPFGTKRIYNGELQSYHSGVDLRARTGAPIFVPFSGKVRLAQDLYYTGNTVILDHGYGLFTLYAHMSKLNVKEDQMLELGELMGLSGSTGRVTGPHLHWAAIVHGERVDPLKLMEVLP
jgi:murein DD-endopeptidase MepM/ murein hydrolase activator NlpD